MPSAPGRVAGPRHDHDVVGDHAVAAPLLAAVEDVAVAVLHGARAHRGDVGAGLRLGNRDRRDDAALGDDRQVFVALLLGAEVKQRHDEHGVEAGDRGAGRRDPGDLLARDAHHRQVAVRAAVSFGHPELHQPHVAEQLDELEREAVGLVDLGRDRRDVLCDHLRTVSRKASCSSVKLMSIPGRSSCRSQKGTSIEWVIHLIIHPMSDQVKPSHARPAPGPHRANRRERVVRSPCGRRRRLALKFRPIHTRRAFEEICERIREQLALGVLKPGDKLPPERDLAQQLGVSRNVLREALRSLEMAGVLRLQKGVKGGAFIQEGDTSRMNDVMRDMLSLGTISVRELSEARIHVLDLVVRLACANARQADFDALEANIERTEDCDAGRAVARPGRMLARVLQAAGGGDRKQGHRHDHGFGHGNSHALRLRQGRVERRRDAAAGGKAAAVPVGAVRERNVSTATRLMRSHLESVQRMLEQDPGRDVASRRVGGDAAGNAPIAECVARSNERQTIR